MDSLQLTVSDRAYLKLTRWLPPRLAGLVDIVNPRTRTLTWGALNGQEMRAAALRQLLAKVAFDEIIETGTYRGETTRWLSAVSGLPVKSVELSPRFFRVASYECRVDHRITLTEGDSREFLTVEALKSRIQRTFFYLDAHWGADVPRLEEVELIRDNWDHCVILIDDFQVLDDPGYGYTSYGTRRLDFRYLPTLAGWQAYYPTAASASETGARRGYVVLASPTMRQGLSEVHALRPVPIDL